MTLTPDQVRLRLNRITYHETATGMAALVELLAEMLPDLVAARPSHTDTYQRGWDVATARAESRFMLGLPIEYGANIGLSPRESP
jgi:hypothetical protein